MIINSEVMRTSSSNKLFRACVQALCPTDEYRKIVFSDANISYRLTKTQYSQRVQDNWTYVACAKKDHISIGTVDCGELMQVTPSTIKIVQPFPPAFLHIYGLSIRKPKNKKYGGVVVVNLASGKEFTSTDPTKPNVGLFPCLIDVQNQTVNFETAPTVRKLNRTRTAEIRKLLREVSELINGYLIVGAYPCIDAFDDTMVPRLSHKQDTILRAEHYNLNLAVRFLCAANTPERIVELASSFFGSKYSFYGESISDQQRYGMTTFNTNIQYFLRNPNKLYQVMGGVDYE